MYKCGWVPLVPTCTYATLLKGSVHPSDTTSHSPINSVCVCLSRVFDVGVIQQVLNAKQNLAQEEQTTSWVNVVGRIQELCMHVCVCISSILPAHYRRCTQTHTHTHTCLIVTAGLQSFSSSNRDRQTVPDGYTFG